MARIIVFFLVILLAMTTYATDLYFTNTDGCAVGTNFGKTMEIGHPIVLDTLRIAVPDFESSREYFTTLSGFPDNTDWETGAFTIYFSVIKTVNSPTVTATINMLGANCTTILDDANSLPTIITGTGEQTISISSKNWLNNQGCTVRMQLSLLVDNSLGALPDTLWLEIGSSSVSRLESEVVVHNGCPGTNDAGCVVQDSITVSDTSTGAENTWTNVGGADKMASLSDAVDNNYIKTATSGVQRMIFGNQSLVAGAVIDSIRVETRGKEFDAGSSNNRYRHRLRMDGNTNFCDGAVLASFTSTYTNYFDRFINSPTAAGTCAGTWSLARIDSINLQLNPTVATNDSVFCTYMDVQMCYHTASGVKRRRRLLQSVAPSEEGCREFAKFGEVECDECFGFQESEFIWSKEIE